MIHCTRKAQRVAAISDPRVKACKRESERLVGNETFKTSDGTRSLMKGEIICDQLGRTAFIRTLEWDPNHRAFQTVNTAQHNGQNEGLWWRNYRRRGSNLSAERCVTKVEINPLQDCCELTVRNAVCYLVISKTITTDTAFFLLLFGTSNNKIAVTWLFGTPEHYKPHHSLADYSLASVHGGFHGRAPHVDYPHSMPLDSSPWTSAVLKATNAEYSLRTGHTAFGDSLRRENPPPTRHRQNWTESITDSKPRNCYRLIQIKDQHCLDLCLWVVKKKKYKKNTGPCRCTPTRSKDWRMSRPLCWRQWKPRPIVMLPCPLSLSAVSQRPGPFTEA